MNREVHVRFWESAEVEFLRATRSPLYRQGQIFARHGVRIERSTLAGRVGGACWWLEPLQARLAAHVFASTKLIADDTPLPLLDPGRGRTKTGPLWVYARDDRPWAGPDPPAAVYFYSPDRRAETTRRPPRRLPGRAAGRWRSLSSGRPEAGPGGRVRDARRDGRHRPRRLLGPRQTQVL